MESEADVLDGVCKLLNHRNRQGLAQLLQHAWLELEESNQWGSRLYSRLTTARIHAPIEDYEQLRALSDDDQSQLVHTFREIIPPRDNSIEIASVEFAVDTSVTDDSNDDVIREVEAQRSLMMAVATGGPRIQAVNDEYQRRRATIEEMLHKLDIPDPNPFNDLWAWYGKWSSGDLPSYQSRRKFLLELYAPLIERLKRRTAKRTSGLFQEPTGWAKIDRTITEVRQRLERASTEEQFQAVGLLCREALISLAQTVFDPSQHKILDNVAVSPTDAKRMLEAYLAAELAVTARQQVKPFDGVANQNAVSFTEGRVWTSMTSGHDFTLRQDGDYLYIDWVNIPAQVQTAGGFAREELKRSPDGKWYGKSPHEVSRDGDGEYSVRTFEVNGVIGVVPHLEVAQTVPDSAELDLSPYAGG